MFAIIECGGKQYKVSHGTIFKVEKLEVEKGKDFSIDQVLLIGDNGKSQIGQPYVKGAQVICEVLGQTKDKKVVVFKYKPKKGYRKKKGHRQLKTVLQVKEIKIPQGKNES
jgi:large subunit ribosomal protein L21